MANRFSPTDILAAGSITHSQGKSSEKSRSEKSSSPSVRKTPSTATFSASPSAVRTTPNRKAKVGSLLRKASTEFNLFFLRIKSLGDQVFSENQLIHELFEDTDADSILDRLDRQSRGYSVAEEKFLLEYRKYKDLDKMYESNAKNQQNEEIKSSSTVYSDGNNPGARFSLKEVMQERYSNHTGEHDETLNEDFRGSGLDDENEQELDDRIKFHDLDLVKLQEQFENDEHIDKNTNIGEILWEYRRMKWVKPTKSNFKQEINEARLLFDQIPKESYVKVYNMLIDKGRPLRGDKRINLYDLMKVMNAGWIAEEKWDRAAKGLA